MLGTKVKESKRKLAIIHHQPTGKLVWFLCTIALWNVWGSKKYWTIVSVEQTTTVEISTTGLSESQPINFQKAQLLSADYEGPRVSEVRADITETGTATDDLPNFDSKTSTNSNESTNQKKSKKEDHNDKAHDKQLASTTLPFYPFGYTADVNRIKTKNNYSFADLSTNVTLFDSFFNNSLAPATSTVPWPNLTTVAFQNSFFYSGYRNEMMAFTILVLDALYKGHNQILLDSLNMKDLYATDGHIEFAELFDVEYWNSFYPRLPRLVRFDRVLHDQYKVVLKKWQTTGDDKYVNGDSSLATEEPIHPYMSMTQTWLFIRFKHGYSQKYTGTPEHKLGLYNPPGGGLNPADILMKQGAIRPTRDFREIIQKHLRSLLMNKSSNITMASSAALNNTATNGTLEYITLHPRVEPDMQVHVGCPSKKVINLKQIIQFVENKWKDPPAPLVFIPINRQILESEVKDNAFYGKNKGPNRVARENLKELNRARDEGLWGGRAKIFELGSNVLDDNPKFKRLKSIGGAMINYEVAINGKIFIGTQVSSYSHDLLGTRFYRGMMENYYFTPEGLFPWITSEMKDPPAFLC